MKLRARLAISLLSLMTLLASCSQLILATHTPEGVADPSLQLRQIMAQQLHADLDAIKLVDTEVVEWADSCLGAPASGEQCVEGKRVGHRVVLEFDGGAYTYHTNSDPLQIRLAAAPPPHIGDEIMAWSLEVEPCESAEINDCLAHGGAVMELQRSVQCESAKIGTSGIAFGPCDGVMMTVNLLEERPQELAELVAIFAPFRAQTSAGQVIFSGQGSTTATPVEARMIAEWARMRQLEAGFGRSGASWGHILSWHRQETSGESCEQLSVNITGIVWATSCTNSTSQTVGKRIMMPSELTQLYTWHAMLQSLTLTPCPECADKMPEISAAEQATVDLYFSGIGDRMATQAEQQAILDFAEKLFESFAE